MPDSQFHTLRLTTGLTLISMAYVWALVPLSLSLSLLLSPAELMLAALLIVALSGTGLEGAHLLNWASPIDTDTLENWRR